MVKCPKCGADAIIRTLNDDCENLHTCRNDSCHFVFNPEKLAKKEIKMPSDNQRKFVFVADTDGDTAMDSAFCTEAELLAELKEEAETYYQERGGEQISVCVWDIENRTSTIYEYVCEKTVTVTVTCY
jgi:hypothetical protein